jgi:DNA-binding PadR family transcriptional regulator
MKRSFENPPEINESQGDAYMKFVDRIIKYNREIFILIILLDKQMCGYDLIKEIFLKFNVFLSMGNVYPTLYSLEEEEILRAEFSRGNMRSKNYSLTPKGRAIALKNLEEFVKAMDHISAHIKR